MKKLITAIATSIVLTASMNVAASAYVTENERKYLESEVAEMTRVMGLSQKEADSLLKLKLELRTSNRKAAEKHGQDTWEFEMARKQNVKTYMRAFHKMTTKEQRLAFRNR